MRWAARLLAVLALGTASALSGPGPLPVAAQSAAEQAIQDVIQRGNAAQVRALAQHDPSPMAETSASDYYRELVRGNQALMDAGVSSIDLVSIDWGPIAVSGTTATATSFETWRTSFAAGPTEFARDRNVYTLAQASDGSWLITGDQHPDGRQRRLTPPAPPEPPPPDVPPAQRTSRNWSGYAVGGDSFTSVAATWTIPALALDGPFGADAAWVGIGGLRSRDLIQAGTEQDVSGAGTVTYQAWVEMLPDFSHPIPLTVLPGDTISVSIDQQAGQNWLFSISNLSSGQAYSRTVEYSSSLSSAEWIEEAPFARRRVLPISQFGSLTFSTASAVHAGTSLSVADLGARPISLIDDAGRLLAIPSELSPDGASFSVSRLP